MKFSASSSKPPIGSLITLKILKSDLQVEWQEKTELLTDEKVVFNSSVAICRYLVKKFGHKSLYGSNLAEQCEVDHWLMFSCGPISCAANFKEFIKCLEQHLKLKQRVNQQYLVGNILTIADYVIFESLFASKDWEKELIEKSCDCESVKQYYSNMESESSVDQILTTLPGGLARPSKAKAKAKAKAKSPPVSKPQPSADGTLESLRKEEGKFVELPGAEKGKVVVRFPPEASGYLHIGHAKAALLNQYYKEAFEGTLIMRFDDTNPAKEKVDFEKVILEDLELLQIKPDKFTHTSNYFKIMLDLCEKMIKSGNAYVDDTDPEVMKADREQKIASKNRNNDVNKNLEMWNEMKKGSEKGSKCCVRAKIDMESPNGCMRDPTIYRCKNEPHPRTGTEYKVYPTYDFACPIVDSIEGVTHCLRTMEYHDRDAQFYWFIDVLGLRKPHIWEYSRLNMTNTVLSKRKLTWFVENNHVNGWDDPRMPTVRGIIRRGMTVEGLKQFVIAQGSSRSVVVMEWDKIWSFNKKVIDPVAPRYTAVEEDKSVPVLVEGANIESFKAPKHPKNPDVGEKHVWTSKKVWIDQADAKLLTEGTNATFINWGNLKITKIIKNNTGDVTEVNCTLNLSDKDYKKTMKLTWLADTDKAPLIPCYCSYFDHIISKAVLGRDEDFKAYIGHQTQIDVKMLGDPELAHVKKSEIIQLQRKGFFICESPYRPKSIHSGVESPIILYHIPDGHSKEMPTGVPKFSTEKVQAATAKPTNKNNVAEVLDKIKVQGDKIRDLKQKKAEKGVIEREVKLLLELKTNYKNLTGTEWKPEAVAPAPSQSASAPPPSVGDASDLSRKITEQGEKVRKLKSEKADKAKIDGEVKVLLQLKTSYKALTGSDWKPGLEAPKAPVQNQGNNAQGGAAELSAKIAEQGDKVRKLKTEKAEKVKIDGEVKILLELKASYKKLTGSDWKPGTEVTKSPAPIQSSAQGGAADISAKISEQGDKVRKLKSEKADKATIDVEVKVLLELKTNYKNITGTDWKPGTEPPKPQNQSQNNSADISAKIIEQGDKVRKLKADKADKGTIDREVKLLLELKNNYKNLTGTDWKPGAEPPKSTPPASSNQENKTSDLCSKITQQGDKVRSLKSNKADKEQINEAVKILLALKEEYKKVTGEEYPKETVRSSSNKDKDSKKNESKKSEPKEQKISKKPSPKEVKGGGDNQVKKVTRLGLEAKKEENLPDWYSQVITKGEMIEYYEVSGCYVLRPWSFTIWEAIRDWFDGEIKKLGVKNCYFPLFVSRHVLEKEKTHIADFAPEVAWVTKSGSSDLAEPIAIRPTSETVMYPTYAKWIQSYRDLPIKLNQWNNVIRWEFKHPQPFLRTREFLWQEGHTAYASKEEAQEEVRTILDLYGRIYTDLLAIPVVKGKKTEKEKFAGGDYTLTTEAFISASGRAIQGATSHHLGQNFSKMFDIIYEDPETQEKKFVYQNSWGITTRTIGVLVMVHADNQGLVLPPRVASIQVVIVACGISVSLSDDEKEQLYKCCQSLEASMIQCSIRASADLRDNYSPGWKFNHWELKGVPLRMEVGPKDMKAGQVVVVRRDTGVKTTLKNDDSLTNNVAALLDDIQASLLAKAQKELDSHVILVKDWNNFCSKLEEKNLLLAPFCGEIPCEDMIKKQSAREDAEVDSNAPAMGAKGLCIPDNQPAPITAADKCIHPMCQNKPKYYTLFGRSY